MNTIKILNLKCGGCVNTVKKGLLSIDGIDEVEVNLDSSTVTIPVTDENIILLAKQKLASLGYPEEGENNTIVHKAKSMVSCSMGKFSADIQ